MNQKISEIFNIRLSKEGRKKIKEWIMDEYGSLYYAEKSLYSNVDIKEFIEDMLETNHMSINELGIIGNGKVVQKKTPITPALKRFKYCPYCGERIVE